MQIGPALWSVVDHRSVVVNIPTLKNYNKDWIFEELNGFLHKSLKYIKERKWLLQVL